MGLGFQAAASTRSIQQVNVCMCIFVCVYVHKYVRMCCVCACVCCVRCKYVCSCLCVHISIAFVILTRSCVAFTALCLGMAALTLQALP